VTPPTLNVSAPAFVPKEPPILIEENTSVDYVSYLLWEYVLLAEFLELL